MKRNFVLWIFSLFLVISCSPYVATFKSQAKQNDIFVSPEMREFSRTHKNPSVVLRVPYVASAVSEGEQKNLSKYNNYYNQIEKNLLKAGFTVRDRGLLNNLLSTGQTNYAEIGKKIETDIIIEVLSIDFGIDNYCHKATIKKSNKEVNIPGNILNAKIAKLELKFTIVEKGLAGAVLTLYITSCTENTDFLLHKSLQYVNFLGRTGWYSSISWLPDYDQDTTEKTIACFSNVIADVLRGNVN
ncbi:MAG: hypothetical protein WCX48_11610 [Bacteroidales bacterium]